MGGLRCGPAQLEKGGSQVRLQLEKRGVLAVGQVQKGVFTAAHTYTEHICE